jgi:hypothetical protein
MTEDTLKEFEEMFNLGPSKDSDDQQAEEYGNSMDAEEPFNELVQEVSEDIQSTSDTGTALEVENPHDMIKGIMAESENYTEQVPEVIEPEPEPEPEPEKKESTEIDMFDDFDSIPEDELKEVKEEPKEVKEEPKEEISEEVKEVVSDMSDFHEEIKQKEEEVVEETQIDQISVESSSMMDGDKIKWSLKSPSAMYESFYRQKKNVLDSCLAGGQIEFSLWSKELEDASVDVVTEVFDQQVIIKQMEAVQQFRNRVKYIGVRVNNQYFLFDRFAPLLRGYLARIQYIKPALKQDGLVLEHMGDIEFYFERLRSLHKSVADAEKNLAAAYEMLSRKVTICMELPPAERYSKPEHKDSGMKYHYEKEKSFQASEELRDFDDLPVDATAGPEEKKSGAVGWDSL